MPCCQIEVASIARTKVHTCRIISTKTSRIVPLFVTEWPSQSSESSQFGSLQFAQPFSLRTVRSRQEEGLSKLSLLSHCFLLVTFFMVDNDEIVDISFLSRMFMIMDNKISDERALEEEIVLYFYPQDVINSCNSFMFIPGSAPDSNMGLADRVGNDRFCNTFQ